MTVTNGATKLLKAGEVAKRFGMLTSTIRYYTSLGLLKADAHSQGGYNLYSYENAKKMLEQIDMLKKKRYTLDEIKRELVK